MTLYFHGTDDTQATRILTEGFDIEAPRRSDPGDFGWGIYLTDSASRARAHGYQVLSVEVDTDRFARILSPYFLKGFQECTPETLVERLFHDVAFEGSQMLSVVADSLEKRVAVARRIREAFLAAGFAGIIAGPDQMEQCEVVIFDPETIIGVTLNNRESRS